MSFWKLENWFAVFASEGFTDQHYPMFTTSGLYSRILCRSPLTLRPVSIWRSIHPGSLVTRWQPDQLLLAPSCRGPSRLAGHGTGLSVAPCRSPGTGGGKGHNTTRAIPTCGPGAVETRVSTDLQHIGTPYNAPRWQICDQAHMLECMNTYSDH